MACMDTNEAQMSLPTLLAMREELWQLNLSMPENTTPAWSKAYIALSHALRDFIEEAGDVA